jgi:alpha-N-arabinofuranosidase
MDAHNTFGAPDRLAPTPFTGATLDEGHLRLVVTPKSIVVLEITCD